jgi:glutaredoxin
MASLSPRALPWSRPAIALLGAAFSILSPSCMPVWTPADMDRVAAECRKGIENGSIAPRQSRYIGIPAAPKPPGTPVVIYGASWCRACALAKTYLARRGIPYVDRDVEEDASAVEDRDAALASVGLAPSTSLPIVDVRGTVTIGFFPCVIEKVW